ncbi:MAG: hypothetical protein IKU38_02365 [Clostridia bacterium]|nr:hypothetical protein [Clostridia bacterium]
MSRKDVFCRVRTQVLLVRSLSEKVRELSGDGLRSLRLDGAPRGNGYRGLDAKMEKKDALERMLRRESELLREYERAARKEMNSMRPVLYKFCAVYYIGALEPGAVCEAIGKSPRQCARYRKEIESE